MRAAYLPLCLIALASLAAADPAPTPPTLSLPAGVRPTHYALDLTIVPSQPAFSGAVTIDLAVDAPTALVWLNATSLAIDGAEMLLEIISRRYERALMVITTPTARSAAQRDSSHARERRRHAGRKSWWAMACYSSSLIST